MHEKKTIGILGGMGPEATAELFNRIIDNTPARGDKDHVNIVIINDPQIPDRTKYLLGRGENPIPKLVENLHKLKLAGADVAVIPCMTAHAFISDLQQVSPIPIINAIYLVDKYLNTNHPGLNGIGLLATKGSYKSKVFQSHLSNEVVIPNNTDQDALMEVIYGTNGIKAGNTNLGQVKKIINIIEKLGNIEAVIAGCTELSLVMQQSSISIPIIDPVTVLAKHIVKLGRGIKIKN